jgi:FkbM family methyltransferase
MTRGLLRTPQMQMAIAAARKLWYAGRGEGFDIAGHHLRYVTGTRPTRLKYRDDADVIVRNDVRQTEFLVENIKRGDFVVDIGASVGQYAIIIGAIVGPDGLVVAFEPERGARLLLERNVALNALGRRVKVEPFAVCDTDGERTFYSRDGDLMSSLERAGFGRNSGLRDIKSTTVSTVTLDNYLASANLGNPQWLKIDAEGAEIQILRGARRALYGDTRIICELHPYAWEAFDSTFDELVEMVAAAGRTMRYLDPARNLEQEGPDYGAVLIEA